MKAWLIFHIAFSMLMARWKQTLVAAIGVTFSITMFISLLGFMSGLNTMLDGLVINRTPHIRLYKEILPSPVQPVQRASDYQGYYHFIASIKPKVEVQEIRRAGAVQQYLEQDSRVLGVAPKIAAQVFYNVGAIDLTGVINGIDVAEETRLFQFQDYVTTGNALDLINTPNSIILGKGAADKMLAQIGDLIQVTSVSGEQTPLKVVGYFQSGLKEIDDVQSYATIGTVQTMLGKPKTYITDIQIKLNDVTKAPQLAKEYGSLFDVTALDIQTANAQFDTGSSIRSLISYAVGITLLIVAGFGIYNILNMMIFEKMDSIAILKATGFSGRDVKGIFLSIALAIGVFGGFWGLVGGFSISRLIDQVPFNTEALPTITTYPVDYNPKIYLIGAIFSIVTTYLAGYFPSNKASRVDPVEIIRGK